MAEVKKEKKKENKTIKITIIVVAIIVVVVAAFAFYYFTQETAEEKTDTTTEEQTITISDSDEVVTINDLEFVTETETEDGQLNFVVINPTEEDIYVETITLTVTDVNGNVDTYDLDYQTYFTANSQNNMSIAYASENVVSVDISVTTANE